MFVKKILIVFFIVILFPIICFAEEPITNAKHIVAIDRKSYTVLYEKDAYTETAMASTTKIMTAILAIENCGLNEIVKFSKEAVNVQGSCLGVSEGSEMTMQDVLYGLMMRSGNDCAIAIAEHISGTTEEFVKLMNKKAKKLNLNHTNFVTPNGLDNENHYTTAYELAIFTDYALKNDIFRSIVGVKTTTISVNGVPRTISNTNELLGNFEGVYGVKTGFTFNAGRCLVSSCVRNGMDIIVVVLRCRYKKSENKR